MEEKIKLLRDRVVEELSKVGEGEHVLLNYDPYILSLLIFDREYEFKKFALPREILMKIDFSNVSFDNFNVEGVDFTGLYNVKLNPQFLYKKSIYNTKLNGVTFIGSFDETEIRYADFTGSIGAHINPMRTVRRYNQIYQEYYYKLENCNFNGVTFTGMFDRNCVICGSKFKGSRFARIKLGNYNIEYCVLTDAEIIGNINKMNSLAGVDFTGAKTSNLFCKRIEINPTYRDLTNAKMSGVKFTNDFKNTTICNTDFTGSIGALIDLRIINKLSNINSCNFTDTIVIDEFGRRVNISADGKLTNSVEDELDILLNLEHQIGVRDKEAIELENKRKVEKTRKKIQEKLQELMILVETSEKLGIEPKNLYHSIPIDQCLFLVKIDDHYEINRDIVNTDLLRFLNLSMIDFTNVLVANIDFRNTGARIDPQKVYNKDISGCKFDDSNVKFYANLDDVKAVGTEFGENALSMKRIKKAIEI